MEKLLARVLESGAKVVLVGDPPQLNPVGPGMPFRQVLQDLGAPRLEDVRRQREPWQQDATVHFSEGRADRERLQSKEDQEKIDRPAACILCACCSTSCPS